MISNCLPLPREVAWRRGGDMPSLPTTSLGGDFEEMVPPCPALPCQPEVTATLYKHSSSRHPTCCLLPLTIYLLCDDHPSASQIQPHSNKQQVATLYIIVYRSPIGYCALLKKLPFSVLPLQGAGNNQLGCLVLTTHKHRGYSKLVFWLTSSFILPWFCVYIGFKNSLQFLHQYNKKINADFFSLTLPFAVWSAITVMYCNILLIGQVKERSSNSLEIKDC